MAGKSNPNPVAGHRSRPGAGGNWSPASNRHGPLRPGSRFRRKINLLDASAVASPLGRPSRPKTMAKPDRPVDDRPASFEAALAELETLVQKMEAGTLTLEQSLDAYRRGALLVGFCRDGLASVQQQVRVLEGDLLRPFEPDGRIEG